MNEALIENLTAEEFVHYLKQMFISPCYIKKIREIYEEVDRKSDSEVAYLKGEVSFLEEQISDLEYDKFELKRDVCSLEEENNKLKMDVRRLELMIEGKI